jgi:branched-chain amino acid transport system substrate-binding protein
MKKIIALVLVLLMVVPFTVACSGGTTATTAPTTAATTPATEPTEAGASAEPTWDGTYKGEVYIGASLALTGSAPLEGARHKTMIQLAVSVVNATGGVQGYKVVCQYEDNANDNTASYNVASKLGADEKILCVIGPQRSAAIAAIDQLVKDLKIPTLCGGTSPAIYDLDNPWMVRFRASDSLVATAAISYMVEPLGLKKIGACYNNDDYGNGARKVAVAWLEAKGMKFEVEEGHNTGDKDMTGGLLKIKDAGCDGMFAWTHAPEMSILIRQFKELGMGDTCTVVGSPTLANQAFYYAVTDEIADGTYSVADFHYTNPDPAVQAFVQKYETVYGYKPDSWGCWYDGANIVINALKNAKELTREGVMEALKATDMVGLIGHIYLDDTGLDLIHAAVMGKERWQEPAVHRSGKGSELQGLIENCIR